MLDLDLYHSAVWSNINIIQMKVIDLKGNSDRKKLSSNERVGKMQKKKQAITDLNATNSS